MLAPRQPGPSHCTPQAPVVVAGAGGEGARPGSRGRAPFPPRRAGGGRPSATQIAGEPERPSPLGIPYSASEASGKGVPRLGGPGGKERRGERRPKRARRARRRPSAEAGAESRATRVLQDRRAVFRGLASPLSEMERLPRGRCEHKVSAVAATTGTCERGRRGPVARTRRCTQPAAPLSQMERRATCSRSPSWSALTAEAAGGGCTARATGPRRRSALGAWMMERPGPCVRSELEMSGSHARCPRERRCMARDAVTREPGRGAGEPRTCTMERPDRAVEAEMMVAPG
jgi:hypothetical protein